MFTSEAGGDGEGQAELLLQAHQSDASLRPLWRGGGVRGQGSYSREAVSTQKPEGRAQELPQPQHWRHPPPGTPGLSGMCGCQTLMGHWAGRCSCPLQGTEVSLPVILGRC